MENKENSKLIIAVVIALIIGLICGYEMGANKPQKSISTKTDDFVEENIEEDVKVASKTEKSSKKSTPSKDKIKVESLGVGKDGNFVVKITNNNNTAVTLSSVDVNFKDENGNFALKKNTYTYNLTIPAKTSVIDFVRGYSDENLKEYTDYDFTIELAYSQEDFVVDNIDVSSNDTGKQIAITVANNSKFEIENPNVIVVYYDGDEIVGTESGYASSSASKGENMYINVDYARDRKHYDEISYDKYEVYFAGARKVID